MPDIRQLIAKAAEREPAPRRRCSYKGDLTASFAASKHCLGPDMRGVVWTPTDVKYDQDADRTRVVWRPMSREELAKMYEALK